jgi:hypothetical protein
LLNLPPISSVLAGLVAGVAIVALLVARGAITRLRRMTESYWELRYETGQLKSRVTRLEVQAGLRTADPEPDAPATPNKTSFVPLSSLKK